MSRIHEHTYDNGLKLVAEPVTGAQSLAMSFLLPAGVGHEPSDQQGVGTLLAEVICRGAGGLDAKAHSDALDMLGVDRGTGVGTAYLHVGATMIGQKLPDAFGLWADMVRRPTLSDESLEPARDLALQAIEAMEDEPQQKVFDVLRQRHYPAPFGRSPLGIRENIEAIQTAQVREYWRRCFVPGGSVLGVSGSFDWEQLKDLAGTLFDDWHGELAEPTREAAGPRSYHHVKADTTQVHIGLAYDAVEETDPDSILQRVATHVLSGGMSARLFTEVREKRGLCYSVHASYTGTRQHGAVLSYAGTTAARAQETLDVLSGEHRRLGEGVEQSEFERAIVGMKSRLVMQGESTSARAHAIASDQTIYGRPRTLDEVAAKVDGVTFEQVNDFVASHRPERMTLVTIGPETLSVPAAADPGAADSSAAALSEAP